VLPKTNKKMATPIKKGLRCMRGAQEERKGTKRGGIPRWRTDYIQCDGTGQRRLKDLANRPGAMRSAVGRIANPSYDL
jgi:hypothetical protein